MGFISVNAPQRWFPEAAVLSLRVPGRISTVAVASNSIGTSSIVPLALRSINVYPRRILNITTSEIERYEIAYVFIHAYVSHVTHVSVQQGETTDGFAAVRIQGYREDVKRIIRASSIAVFR